MFPILNGYQKLKTKEQAIAYALAYRALSMKQSNPNSRLWSLRVKQALRRLEQCYFVNSAE